jgi:hypothetical protein
MINMFEKILTDMDHIVRHGAYGIVMNNSKKQVLIRTYVGFQEDQLNSEKHQRKLSNVSYWKNLL